MGLDDFFEQGNKRHKYGHESDFDNRKKHYSSHKYNRQNDLQSQLLDKIKNNPNLKKIIIGAVIGVILIILVLIALLFPLLSKLLGFVTENGVQGILESIWKGTK